MSALGAALGGVIVTIAFAIAAPQSYLALLGMAITAGGSAITLSLLGLAYAAYTARRHRKAASLPSSAAGPVPRAGPAAPTAAHQAIPADLPYPARGREALPDPAIAAPESARSSR